MASGSSPKLRPSCQQEPEPEAEPCISDNTYNTHVARAAPARSGDLAQQFLDGCRKRNLNPDTLLQLQKDRLASVTTKTSCGVTLGRATMSAEGAQENKSGDEHPGITVFSLDQCPHCKRSKALLDNRGWRYVNISLDSYPQMKSGMLQLADQLTVPQIFFGEHHVGGASDLLALDSAGELDALYDREVVRAAGPPTNPLLQKPTTPPVAAPVAPPLTEAPISVGRIFAGDVSELSYGELVARLRASPELARRDHRYHMKTYRRCFPGSHLVDALLAGALQPPPSDLSSGDETKAASEGEGVASRSAAVSVACTLLERGVLAHVTGEHEFEDTDGLWYRLTCDNEPLVLNRWRKWNDRVDTDAVALVTRLKKALGKIVSTHTAEDTGLVDYDAVEHDERFPGFEEASCEIQGVDLTALDEDTRMAFCINLYNMMIVHAFAKLGRPETSLTRMAFFGQVSYDIGGEVYSFHAVESGVLRANKKAPFHLSPPFSEQDPRHPAAFSVCDPRIHFALNCGASSCPPVKTFTGGAIQEELRIVAQAFCEQDGNVEITANGTVRLSQIFGWYMGDFGANKEEALSRIATWLRGEKKAKLEALLAQAGRKAPKVEMITYDWTSNALPESKRYGDGNSNKSGDSYASIGCILS